MEAKLLSIFLTCMVHVPFLVNGYQQLTGDWRSRYRKWNMPQRMSYLLVPIQLLLNVLLWFPAYQVAAAGGLGLILLAAVMTMTRYYEQREAYLWPVLGLAALAAWAIWGM